MSVSCRCQLIGLSLNYILSVYFFFFFGGGEGCVVVELPVVELSVGELSCCPEEYIIVTSDELLYS